MPQSLAAVPGLVGSQVKRKKERPPKQARKGSENACLKGFHVFSLACEIACALRGPKVRRECREIANQVFRDAGAPRLRSHALFSVPLRLLVIPPTWRPWA